MEAAGYEEVTPQPAEGQRLRQETLRSAGIMALVFAALFLLYFLVLAPLADPLDPRASRQDKTSYTNRALDLCFTLPEGWTFLGDAELDALREAGEPYMENGTWALTSGGQLMMAGDPRTGVNAQIICTKNTSGRQLDGADIQSVISLQLLRLPEGTQSQWLEPVRVGKVTYEALQIRCPFQGLTMEGRILIGSRADYVAMLFIIGQEELEPAQFLAAFS